MLIQTGRPLSEFGDADIAEFTAAITAREQAHGRQLKHYRTALHATRAVLYHLGAAAHPAHQESRAPALAVATALRRCPNSSRLIRWWPTWNAPSGTRTRSTVLGIACRLGHFARFLTDARPDVHLAGRTGSATPHRAVSGRGRRRPQPAHRNDLVGLRAALADSDRRAVDRRHQSNGAGPRHPARQLVFARDVPRLPRALPRYLPPDADRRLSAGAARLAEPAARRRVAVAAGHRDAHRRAARSRAGLRARGSRRGRLVEGAAGQARHRADGADRRGDPRAGRPDRRAPLARAAAAAPAHRQARSEFLLTHQGRRLSVDTLRAELSPRR